MQIDWAALRSAAIEAMRHAYAPYSDFPVGAAGLVDDGRVVVGCNVENAGYGVTLCAECGVVSSLHATGGGRLVALSCVDATGSTLMPCGRCRQLLWEHGGAECLVEAVPRPLRMAELLPHAFGREDLDAVTGPASVPEVPPRLARWRGRGTVFVHPEMSGGEQVWTGYWERSAGDGEQVGILEEGPMFPTVAAAVTWGRVRTSRIVVVDAAGDLSWAGEGEPPGGDPGAVAAVTAGGLTAVDVIRTKRDGGALSPAQIDWVVDGYTRGLVADEQMSALAMAILLRGMTAGEIARWTAAMIASGERLDLSGIARPTVDKHSTGGVGDKITLPLTPLVAACGAAVPQLSGRGLGHTGGTLDKLESIPGWRATLDNDDFLAQLGGVGAVICAAGAGLAPADRKLYALRDVTGTVESVPLIASSIMSKKIAEGTGALVLDVKVGSGAFMKDLASARELARTMVELGRAHGVRTVALLTDMSTPLGLAVGNAVEVTESLEVLAGGGPPDVVELTCTLAAEMLAVAGLPDVDPAAVLATGAAMDTWRAMIRAQGGDPDAPMPVAAETELVRAPADGVVAAVDAYGIGRAAWLLGAGRARKEDPVAAAAGILLRVRPGDRVRAGDPLFELRTDDPATIPPALAAADGAVTVTDAAPAATPLVLDRVG